MWWQCLVTDYMWILVLKGISHHRNVWNFLRTLMHLAGSLTLIDYTGKICEVAQPPLNYISI